ncbi:hypothetical protein TRIUR3_14948 [Triticum urartu]|uniref:Uncharacterized protein n=1 Tax=Triticum urartu TaxID=4572 RepID=M7Z5T0_TRIUA|nr:hypothetical protein TRIUR3_14948 [Triticum urartu]
MAQSRGHQARAHGGDREGAALKRRRMSPNASARVGDEQIAQAPTSESLQRRGSQNAGHVDHGDAGGLHAAAPGAGHPNPHKPDCCLERRRPGDSSAAVVRIGGAEWVVRRRSVRSAAAGGESPGDTVHRSAPQVEHVHNGDGLHAERRRFRPQRVVPGACIGPRAAPDFEVGEPAAYECYLQRRRPGDSSRAVFRAAGVEWVLRRRPCIRAAAAGDSPVLLPQANHYDPSVNDLVRNAQCTPHANLAQLIRSLNCLPSMASGPNCPIPGVLISSWHWTGPMKVPLRY